MVLSENDLVCIDESVSGLSCFPWGFHFSVEWKYQGIINKQFDPFKVDKSWIYQFHIVWFLWHTNLNNLIIHLFVHHLGKIHIMVQHKMGQTSRQQIPVQISCTVSELVAWHTSNCIAWTVLCRRTSTRICSRYDPGISAVAVEVFNPSQQLAPLRSDDLWDLVCSICAIQTITLPTNRILELFETPEYGRICLTMPQTGLLR